MPIANCNNKHATETPVCRCSYVATCIAVCSDNCTACFCLATGIVKVDNSGGRNLGMLQKTSLPVDREKLFGPLMLGPMCAASICVSLRCAVPRPSCSGSVQLRCGLCTICSFLVDKKNQLDVTFSILYFSSNSYSTCFGQPCAHHQELITA